MPAQAHPGNGQPVVPAAVASVAAVPHQPAPQPAAPMMAAPQPQSLPAPVVPAPVMPAAAVPATSSAGKGKHKASKVEEAANKKKKGRFRETMWFKKGELDAQAASEAVVAQQQGAIVSDKADQLPLEDRYEDDGTLSTQDQHSFSLRTGHTQAMPAMKDERAHAPSAGDSVSAEDLIGEMKGGRGAIIAAVVVGLVVVIGVVVFFLTR
jgi:hypothetical protein